MICMGKVVKLFVYMLSVNVYINFKDVVELGVESGDFVFFLSVVCKDVLVIYLVKMDMDMCKGEVFIFIYWLV